MKNAVQQHARTHANASDCEKAEGVRLDLFCFHFSVYYAITLLVICTHYEMNINVNKFVLANEDIILI